MEHIYRTEPILREYGLLVIMPAEAEAVWFLVNEDKKVIVVILDNFGVGK